VITTNSYYLGRRCLTEALPLQLSLIARLRTAEPSLRGQRAAGKGQVKYCCQEVVENQAKRNDLAGTLVPPLARFLYLRLQTADHPQRADLGKEADARGVHTVAPGGEGSARLISIFCWRLAFIICMFFPDSPFFIDNLCSLTCGL